MFSALRRFNLSVIMSGLMLIISSGCSPVTRPIMATLTDGVIQLSRNTATAGNTPFEIINKTGGNLKHEFVIIKTDLPFDQFPKNADGTVDEEKLTSSGEQGDIEPGQTVYLTVNLHPGHYVMMCNLPGHFAMGMHTEFTVSQ